MDRMTATWTGGMGFEYRSASGHGLVTDAPLEKGGGDTAASPMELLLLGMIGCTGVDVASILESMKQPLEGLQVAAEFEKATDHPRVYTKIHVIYTLKGDLDKTRVQRAIDLSENKYCSASAMLGKTATITHEFHIQD